MAKQAVGKRVLNCFAYTGAFSVHAAAAGAVSTRSLDLSATYCQWARRNFEHNGLSDRQAHRITRTDVLAWLDEPVDDEFDIIVCDPPTFSNSKRMSHDWVVGRDHTWLLERLRIRLAPGGQCWFSTNDRRFSLSDDAMHGWESVTDMTETTIPEDCARRRPHQCWLFQAPA